MRHKQKVSLNTHVSPFFCMLAIMLLLYDCFPQPETCIQKNLHDLKTQINNKSASPEIAHQDCTIMIRLQYAVTFCCH